MTKRIQIFVGIILLLIGALVGCQSTGKNEYVLSKWFDSRDKANELGQYHGDFKYKGHRWRIDERVKPEQVKR